VPHPRASIDAAAAAPPQRLVAWGSAAAREFGGLTADTVAAWWRLLPTLAALTLMGWAAYHASVLGAAQVAIVNVWLIIPVLAAGVVAQLATLVIAIRAVAHRLGTVDLLHRVLGQEAAKDDRDRSLLRLLSLTLLPFLGIYAAFGYVQQFARDVVILSELSLGFGGLLSELNPVSSPVVGAVVVIAVLGLYVVRRLLDALFERRQNPLVGTAAVLVEATLVLLLALSGFRLFEQFGLWWHDRAVQQWWDLSVGWLTGWLHWDLPPLLRGAWNFLRDAFWPVFLDVISKPIAWLALAALVVGARIRSFAELWSTDVPVADDAGWGTRIRARLTSATGIRRVVLRTQDAAFGDLDDKYLPVWQALRLVLKAGWVHLGAFVLAYGVLQLGGDWLVTGVLRLIGGVPVTTGLVTAPLIDLIPDVLVMSLQISLLAVALGRILQHQAHARDTDGTPAPTRRSRAAEIAIVAALLVGFTAVWMARPSDSVAPRVGALGREGRLDAQLVRIDAVDYGTRLTVDQGRPTTTGAAFVVVRFACYRPGADGEAPQVDLVNGERTYHSGGWGWAPVLPQPGFENAGDVVFEIDPADLDSGLSARVSPGAGVTAFHDELLIPLGLADNAAVDLAGRGVVASDLSQRQAR
jgi:hypothetical protein